MMLEFFPIKPKSFGIEISDSAVRIAQLKPDGKFFDLKSWGEEKIAPGTVEEGEIKDREALKEAIKKTIKEIKGEKIKTKYLAASLPEAKAFLRVIRMPKMTEAELQSAVPFEAENYIPFSINEVYLDFQAVKADDHAQEVLITACPKTIVDSYLALFRETGFYPIVFEPESMAIRRSLIGGSRYGVGVLDMGETKADFIIFSEEAIRFTSSFSVTGQDFSQLANQINQYIEYCFSHHLAKKKVEKILLSGEKEDLKKLADFLSRELRIQTELGNPWVNILPEGKTPPLSPRESLKYATALGLALRAQLTTNDL